MKTLLCALNMGIILGVPIPLYLKDKVKSLLVCSKQEEEK